MITRETKEEVRAWTAAARATGERIALVPTMGSLHEGHLSLTRLARRHADRVALSIFVNPLQFGPGEDLARYPRSLERDLEMARGAGIDLVFAPAAREMYPDGPPAVTVVPDLDAELLEGAARPGHFRGVLTVVAKLLGIFLPDVAVFGQKDYQQLTFVRRMVHALDLPVEIVAGPIVREPDGLAMSSRNAYLTPDDRARAIALSRALEGCRESFAAGERDPGAYRAILAAAGRPGLEVEYGDVIHPESLEQVARVEQGTVCVIAARVGPTRLIDNAILGA